MRKRLEKIIILSSIAAVFLVLAIIPVSSYLSYKKRLNEYLNANVKEKVSDPVLEGLTLTLEEGKEYYANGKAFPVKSDFVLKATYSIGVDVYDDEVLADKFTLTVPEDFSENGGRVTATFEEKEASLDISLTPVMLDKLYFLEKPYIVCYKENEKFSPEGMKLEAAYNDGTIVEVGGDYAIDDDLMTIGKTSVKATFTHKGESVRLDIPVRVLSEKEFTNGKLLSVKAENTPTVKDGEALSSSDISLRGTFESGNRIILSDGDFTLKNGDKKAAFGEKTVAELRFNDNAELEYLLPLKVFSRTEAENGRITGGVIKNGKSYVLRGEDYVLTGDVTFVGSFEKSLKEGEKASLKITVNVKKGCYGSIRLTIANGYILSSDGYYSENLKLNDVMTVYADGAFKGIGDDVIVKGVKKTSDIEKTGSVYSRIEIDGFNFFEGDNEIIIAFKNNNFLDYNGDPAAVNIDCIDVMTYGEENLLTFSDFVKYCEKSGKTAEYKLNQIETRMIVGGFDSISGACTDGEYIYYSFVGPNNKKGVVVKYKVGEGVIAKTEIFDLHDKKNEDGTDGWSYLRGNLAYIKGKIVCLCEGYFVTVDPETMHLTVNMDLPFKEVNDLYKANPEQIAYTLTYNEKLDRYAVSVKEYSWSPWGYLYIYDGQFNLIKGGIRLACREDVKWGGFELRSTFSNDDYIYATYSFSYSWAESAESNAKFDAYRYKSMTELIDWDGNSGGIYDIDGFNSTGNNYNHVMNFVELNGKFYVGCYDNGGLNGGYIYEVTPVMGSLGGGDNPKPDKPLFIGKDKGWTILGRDERQYVNGSVCDGEYVYFALADANSNTCVVEKFTISGDYVGKSEVIRLFDGNTWTTDSANISDCGDKIRLLKRDGSSVLIDKQSLAVEADTLSLPSALPEELSLKITGEDGAYWLIGYAENAAKTRKVALIREGLWNTDFKLFVYDENNARVNSRSADGISTSGRTVRAMATDNDFIYVVCGNTNAKDYSVFVFDFDGNMLKEIVLEGLLPASENPGALEVQSLYLEGNKICVVFYDTGAYVYELTFSSFANMKDYIENCK